MPIFCISLPGPKPRLRPVIVIVIYLAAFRPPAGALTLALVGIAAGLLAVGTLRLSPGRA
jgi:hypothetical protein